MAHTINGMPADEYRKMEARSLGLPETATIEEITEERIDLLRRTHTKTLGIPEDASWEEVYDKLFEPVLRESAVKRGLPEGATLEDILAYDSGIGVTHNGDTLRRASAKDFGLPEDSSWDVIRQHLGKAEAKRLAQEILSLPHGTTIITL